MERIPLESEYFNTNTTTEERVRKIGEKAMYARLFTNVHQLSLNESTKELLSENDIPFVSLQVDVPEPELTVNSAKFLGVEQIQDNINSIKQRLQS